MATQNELKSSKRPNMLLSDKIKAIEDIKEGKSIAEVAKELNVHTSTVRKWVQSEEDIMKWCLDRGRVVPVDMKRIKNPVNELIDHATWIWFQQQRLAGNCFDRGQIQMQALNNVRLLGVDTDFKASHSWLMGWKARHGVKTSTINGEKVFANVEGAEAYKMVFQRIIREDNLIPDQVFNCEKIALNFKQMPPKTLYNEQLDTSKSRDTERTTILACSNASATCKLPLLMIGKFPKPRALKNLKNLPADYRNQMTSSMTTELFRNWFHEKFVPHVTSFLLSRGLSPKAVLFVSPFSIRSSNLRQGDIRVEYFPASTSPLIQPMEQGCLQNLKSLYRIRLMNFLTEHFRLGSNVSEATKDVSIRHAINWASDAWTTMKAITIVKSWKPLWPDIEELSLPGRIHCPNDNEHIKENEQSINAFHELLQKQREFPAVSKDSIINWINPPYLLNEDECLTDDEIVQLVKEERDFDEKENEIEKISEQTASMPAQMSLGYSSIWNNSAPGPSVTFTQAETSLRKIIQYCKTNSFYSNQQVAMLLGIQEWMQKEPVVPTNSTSNTTISFLTINGGDN